MTLVDALFEIALRWDEEVSPRLDPDTRQTVARQLDDGLAADEQRPLAAAVHALAADRPDDDPIIRAAERSVRRGRPYQSPDPRDAFAAVLGSERGGAPSARASMLGLPAFAPPDGADWRPVASVSDEAFLATAIRRRMDWSEATRQVRAAARRDTLRGFTTRAQGQAAFVAVTADSALDTRSRPALMQDLIAFDPVDAFLELPEHLRQQEYVAEFRQIARLAPTFQVLDSEFHDAKMWRLLSLGSELPDADRPVDMADFEEVSVSQQVNETLDAANDPWGVGSWWTTRNAWLGVAPLDLLGTERELEIVLAARELTSGAW